MSKELKAMFRLVFIQMALIAFGILLGNSIVSCIAKLNGTEYTYNWYFPFAIITTAFVTSMLSFIIYVDFMPYIARLILHFFCLLGAVTLASFLFDWYTTFPKLLIVYAIMVTIYVIVWIVTLGIMKKDENLINKKLENNKEED